MLGATVYVSLTRSKAPLLAELAAAARAHGALLHLFHDAEYSRAALSLSSASPAALANGCAAVAATAVAQVDLAAHGAEAAHPAVGVVDHITCWPRGPEAVAGAGAVATRMRALGPQSTRNRSGPFFRRVCMVEEPPTLAFVKVPAVPRVNTTEMHTIRPEPLYHCRRRGEYSIRRRLARSLTA